ncbi:MAG: DUF4386 family protein, partial [Nitrososphaerota archaeon]|nr:DUF4386 family protein [Nitrososphaerota archaeon]
FEEAKTHVDPTWRSLYRIGGIAMSVTGFLYYASVVLSAILGPAPSSGEAYLNALAGHVSAAQLNFMVWIIADFLLIAVTFALYLALKGINKNAMLLASAFMGLFVILDLGLTELNSLVAVSLSQSYTAATTDAIRSTYIAASNYALATLPLATFYSFFISSIGVLIIGLVMMKGVFPRAVGLLGIAVGIEGTLASFYVLVPILSVLMIPSLATFGMWSIFAGVRLFRLR